MMPATPQVHDAEHFLTIFSTQGAEKHQQRGSTGSVVCRDPNGADRM